MIESINLFPYIRFLRIKGDHELNHTCGGVTSLIQILVIAGAFIVKFVEVIKM